MQLIVDDAFERIPAAGQAGAQLALAVDHVLVHHRSSLI
jgi:hypothetical protein